MCTGDDNTAGQAAQAQAQGWRLGRCLTAYQQALSWLVHREEDKQFQSSDTAQRRQEMQRKAEERAREESEKLRKAAAETRAKQVGTPRELSGQREGPGCSGGGR